MKRKVPLRRNCANYGNLDRSIRGLKGDWGKRGHNGFAVGGGGQPLGRGAQELVKKKSGGVDSITQWTKNNILEKRRKVHREKTGN